MATIRVIVVRGSPSNQTRVDPANSAILSGKFLDVGAVRIGKTLHAIVAVGEELK